MNREEEEAVLDAVSKIQEYAKNKKPEFTREPVLVKNVLEDVVKEIANAPKDPEQLIVNQAGLKEVQRTISEISKK